MNFSDDMKDFIRLLEGKGVLYLLVGGVAVNHYGYNRTTQDLDILIYPSEENAKKVTEVLKEFGFGDAGIPESIFQKPGGAIHLGEPPNRIDILTSLKEMNLEKVFQGGLKQTLFDIEIKIISLLDLIETKKKTGRMKDLADADELERIHKIS